MGDLVKKKKKTKATFPICVFLLTKKIGQNNLLDRKLSEFGASTAALPAELCNQVNRQIYLQHFSREKKNLQRKKTPNKLEF